MTMIVKPQEPKTPEQDPTLRAPLTPKRYNLFERQTMTGTDEKPVEVLVLRETTTLQEQEQKKEFLEERLQQVNSQIAQIKMAEGIE